MRLAFVPLLALVPFGLVAILVPGSARAAGSGADARFDALQELVASGGAEGERLGTSVDASGDWVLAGADRDGVAGDEAGAAVFFRYDGATWVETEEIRPAGLEADDRFGGAVAIDGDVAIVGATGEAAGGILAGAAWAFRFDGTDWVEEQKLVPSDPGTLEQFGVSVAVEGDVAVVGAYFDGEAGADAGAAYVFRHDGASWNQEAKLLAPDADPGDLFGVSVAVSLAGGDGVAVVGSLRSDAGGAMDAGAAYVFRFDGATWVPEAKLFASDASMSAELGASVAVEGDLVIAGAPSDSGGVPLGAAIGAGVGPGSGPGPGPGPGPDTGAAYAFRYDGKAWAEERKLVASDAAAGSRFGASVAVSAGSVAVGAASDSEAAERAGAVYLFEREGADWAERQKLLAAEGGADDRLGSAVGFGGDVLVAGARRADLFTGAVHAAFAPRCLAGSVNDETGPITDILLLQGSAGDPVGREVTVVEGERIFGILLRPPAGGNGRFVVHAHLDPIFPSSQTPLQVRIGTFCYPLLLDAGASPDAVWNGLGRPDRLGTSQWFDGSAIANPDPAPDVFVERVSGDPVWLPAGTRVTFQGAIVDPGAASRKGVSTTNAVVLAVVAP